MRILYIVNDLAYFRAHRENVALALSSQGHEIFVASGDYQGIDISDWPSNMELLPLEMNKHALDPKSDAGLVQKLRSLMIEYQPNIVHAITIKPILMSAISVRFFMPKPFRLKTKFVWTLAGLGKIFEKSNRWSLMARKQLVIQTLRFCARGIDVSATFENSVDRDTMVQNGIISKDKAHVIWGAGLSLEKYKPDRPRKKEQPLVFLMAARLIREKGVDTYLKIAAKFSTHSSQPRFLLAGAQDPTNPDNVDLAEIKAAENAGHIEFVGAVSGDNMPALYNRADVFCLPTRLQEGFPRSLLEAAACGCGLIASNQTSIRQVLIEGETGLLLPTASVEELCQTVESTLPNPNIIRNMGLNAYNYILTLPISEERIIESFKKVYFSHDPN